MTPPVAHDPSLRIPGLTALTVAGFSLVAFVTFGVLQSALVTRPNDAVYSPTTMALTIATYAVMAGAILWAARQTGDWRRALGLVAPRSWPRALGLSALLIVSMVAVSAALEPVLHAARAQGLEPDHARPPGFLPVLGAVLACIALAFVGPFVEEMFFRGMLTATFWRRFGPLRTGILTAVLFALAHLLPRLLPPILIFGLGLAYLYQRTGSTLPGVLTHCLYNGFGVAVALTH
jgi:membrane protease YdiL (CAAX protease family)